MIHSTQMYIPLKPLFSKHKGVGVQFTDEPTGALDQKTGHEVLELLKEINKSGKTVIIVTHDEGIAKMTDRIITISDGKIVGDN